MSHMPVRSQPVDPSRAAQRTPPGQRQDQRAADARRANAPTPNVRGPGRLSGRGNGTVRQSLLQGMQQSGGNRAVQRFLGRRGNRTVQRTGSTRSPAVSIQRLITREEMERLAGPVGNVNKMRATTYEKILRALTRYARLGDGEAEARTEVLTDIRNLCRHWLDAHMDDEGEVARDEDRRRRYIEGLEVEVSQELNLDGRKGPDQVMRPGAIMEKHRQDLEGATVPDYQNPDETLTGPQKYVLTVGVWRENPDFVTFQEKRTTSTVRNKVRGWLTSEDRIFNTSKFGLFGTRESKRHGTGTTIKKGLFTLSKPKTNEEIKEKAARRVIELNPDYHDLSEGEIQRKKTELSNQSGATGHTWIKLNTKVNDSFKAISSFGYYAAYPPPSPTTPVPGNVVHPDGKHEDGKGGQLLFIDYEVSENKYKAAMRHVLKLFASPPDYTVVGYNCTKFAEEVAEKAGVTLPTVAIVTPKGKTSNPSGLYEGMERQDNAYSDAPDLGIYKQVQEEIQQETQERLIPPDAVEIRSTGGNLWPGEFDHPDRAIRLRDGEQLYMIGEKRGQHPYGGNDKVEPWLQVMYIDPDEPTEAITGWILKEDPDQGGGDDHDRNPLYNPRLGGGNRNYGNIGVYNRNTDW
jgi:hypothetical protein